MSSVGLSKECAICGTSDAQLIRTCQLRGTFISECIATTFRDDDVRIRPSRLAQHACKIGLKGIVSKRLGSHYRSTPSSTMNMAFAPFELRRLLVPT